MDQRAGPPYSVGDVRGLARGMAVIRILFGLTFLLNSLAKMFEFHQVRVGPYVPTSSTRPTPGSSSTSRSTTTLNITCRCCSGSRTTFPPNWGTVKWLLTATELVAGLLLLLGIASRLGALIALLQAGLLFFVYFSNDRWLPEQFLEIVPLAVLALVASGRVCGLDRRLARHRLPDHDKSIKVQTPIPKAATAGTTLR